MKYKNMKIEINESQPIDDVVKELERLGYRVLNKYAIRRGIDLWLVANCDGFIVGWRNALILGDSYYKTTNLTELKAMTND